MALVRLGFHSIASMNLGAAQEIIEHCLDKAQADLTDRGDDGKPRVVNIRVILTKEPKSKKFIGEVEAEVKLPSYRTNATIMDEKVGNNSQGYLVFQDMNPENPEQPTFPEMDQQ